MAHQVFKMECIDNDGFDPSSEKKRPISDYLTLGKVYDCEWWDGTFGPFVCVVSDDIGESGAFDLYRFKKV